MQWGRELLTLDAAHCQRSVGASFGVKLERPAVVSRMLFVQAEGSRGASVALDPGIGDAVEVLAGGEVGGEERRVLVPRRVLEVVLGAGWAVHCRSSSSSGGSADVCAVPSVPSVLGGRF